MLAVLRVDGGTHVLALSRAYVGQFLRICSTSVFGFLALGFGFAVFANRELRMANCTLAVKSLLERLASSVQYWLLATGYWLPATGYQFRLCFHIFACN